MKRLLFVLLAVTVLSTTAHADVIGLYSDPTGGFCAAPSTPLVLNTVYVIHQFSSGATRSAWRITNDTDQVIYNSSCGQLSIQGNVIDGIEVFYPGCMTGSFVICQVGFLKLTTEPEPGCYQLNVVGFNSPTPTYVDCNDNQFAAEGWFFTFDIDLKPSCWDCSTPVESRTWGNVKALYR